MPREVLIKVGTNGQQMRAHCVALCRLSCFVTIHFHPQWVIHIMTPPVLLDCFSAVFFFGGGGVACLMIFQKTAFVRNHTFGGAELLFAIRSEFSHLSLFLPNFVCVGIGLEGSGWGRAWRAHLTCPPLCSHFCLSDFCFGRFRVSWGHTPPFPLCLFLIDCICFRLRWGGCSPDLSFYSSCRKGLPLCKWTFWGKQPSLCVSSLVVVVLVVNFLLIFALWLDVCLVVILLVVA